MFQTSRTLPFAVILALLFSLPVSLSAGEPLFTQDREVKLEIIQEFPKLGKEFSGVTHAAEDHRYWVLDDGCKVIELALQEGKLEHKRTVRLQGLDDCEGIAVLEDGTLAVTEERRGNVAFFKIEEETSEIICPRDCRLFHVDQVSTFTRPNSGLESLTVDGAVLYTGKEEFPRKIYKLTPRDESYEVTFPWDAETKLPAGSDLAGMAFFEGSLFIVDERKDVIRQVDPSDGTVISSFRLSSVLWPFHRYEGISLKRDGNTVEMVIAAEPSEIRIYRIETK